ncbi:glyoxylate/hydroxypyruvate reductase A [Kiloniella laminariae]|uniref:Glyoxylate/hydroxypyruvate reductase A n=1 Tax=Kiloniella laminariae TaxID=454162 RepID=A0ABT4LN18_9PROT|nr:glyoxylate/hydroxypyruvate reductase A [Kiloniella laminariae]MCZ4281731.1 glyoxylate/hydroxypyruvate reductase A [Kiloniella laminariae]
MTILLLTSVPADEENQWLGSLRAALPEEEILLPRDMNDKATVELAVVANPPKGVLAELPNLRWIQSLWAGVDALLMDPTLPEDVPLVRLVDPTLARSMAEAVATHVLALHRNLPLYAKQQQQAKWQQHILALASDREIGVMGLGEMGALSAAQLHQLGFKVRGWSRSPKSLAGVGCFAGPESLPAFLSGLDVLVNLLPLTDETRGILSRELFDRLPKGAGLINFGRGGHQIEEDILVALDSGQLSHAVLDVFSQEPLPADHAFWRHPDITLLPHVAAPTNPRSAVEIVAGNIRCYRSTGELPKTVERLTGY